MADFRVPPPHTPIPPSSHQVESSTQHQKAIRLEEFELLQIKIEQFVIMASNDPQTYENVFMQISNLKELIQSGILNADQENILIEELSKLDFELNSGSIKIKNIYDRFFLFNTHLEETFPKIKVFNMVQSLKNNLFLSPLDDLPPMNKNEFESFEKSILLFINEDIEEFSIKNLFNKLKTIHETFLHHPRRNQTSTINELNHIADDIRSGSF